MSVRTLLIGNSHIVCIKEALTLEPTAELGDLVWMYAPGVELSELKVVDGVVTSRYVPTLEDRLKRQGSAVKASLSDVARVVVVGIGLNIGLLASLRRDFVCFSALYSDSVLEKRTQLVSSEFLAEASKDRLRNSGAIRVCRVLRDSFSRPIYVVPQPNPLELLRSRVPASARERRAAAIWSKYITQERTIELHAAFNSSLMSVADDLGIVPLLQQEETMSGGLTHKKYVRKKGEHRSAKIDVAHTNAAYGAKVLELLKRHVVTE